MLNGYLSINLASIIVNYGGFIIIFFKLVGGLGNQLFIYAFARSISHDLDKELFLDISRYGFDVPIEHFVYALHPFNIKAIVGNYPSTSYLNNDVFKHSLNIYEKGIPLTEHSLFREGLIDQNADDIKFPAYFTGYYSAGFDENDVKVITEKFFIHNEKLIREDLEYLPKLSSYWDDLINDIKKNNSIAIHIRRGEYKDFEKFGTCSIEYYHKAINEIAGKVENPKFFIFTEDHDWVKQNINIPFPHRHVYFERKKEVVAGGYAELLKIFSLCNHFIIANSTFSWWGSWLSDNENKIIIAPKPWFQSRELVYPDSISNKKPILIENTYKEIFNSSDNNIFNISDFISQDYISYKNIQNSLKNLRVEGSTIFLPKLIKNSDDALMLKIAMSTNSMDNVTIFYKINTNSQNHENDSIFKIFYYNNDSFEQYVPLPSNINLDSIRIKLSNDINSEYSLKSLEINSIKSNESTESNIELNKSNYENSIKFDKLNNILNDNQLNLILSKFFKARVDLKNFGNSSNSVIIEDIDSGTNSSYPPWWDNNEGKGLVVKSTKGILDFKIKCINDGILKIFLRAEDVRDNVGSRIPVYMRYNKFLINGVDIINNPVYVHHDEPFFYKTTVKNSDIFEIHVEWEPI